MNRTTLYKIAALLLSVTSFWNAGAALIKKDTIKISNAEELIGFADSVNNKGKTTLNAILTADITLNTGVIDKVATGDTANMFTAWTPIGNGTNNYAGHFNGAGHTISGIYFNNTKKNIVGLFGKINSAVIDSINITDSYYNGNNKIGGVAGFAVNSKINFCSFDGVITAHNGTTGGIVGYGSSITISYCHNKGIISGSYNMGGIAGSIESTNNSISNCYNLGSISANYTSCSGIANASSQLNISQCYNLGTITGVDSEGGISADSNNCTISSCYTLTNACKQNGGGMVISQEAVNNGELCYKLSQAAGEGNYWRQTIGVDNYPNFEGDTVVKLDVNDETSYYVSRNGILNDIKLTDGTEFGNVPFDIRTLKTSYNRNISNNWGTLCLPFAYTKDNINVQLFSIKDFCDSLIVLKEINEAEAGQPVIFYANEPNSGLSVAINEETTLTTEPLANQYLTGTFENETPGTNGEDVSKMYYLNGNVFKQGNQNFNLKAYRAFIKSEIGEYSSYSLGLNNKALTGNITNKSNDISIDAVYDLSGRKTNQMGKGKIYILKMSNGSNKKIMINE